MRITAALAAELSSLGGLVGIPELTTAVQDLLADYASAVPSCLGLRVSSPALGPGHAIETERRVEATPASAQASLRLDLLGGDLGPDRPLTVVSVLILAGQAGAFADFVGGADPLNRQGFRIVRRTVDDDLDPATARELTERDRTPLDDVIGRARVVNRAIGVLIDRGYPPEAALQVLEHDADTSGRTTLDQAWTIVQPAPGRVVQPGLPRPIPSPNLMAP
jgi:hypothetical protein